MAIKINGTSSPQLDLPISTLVALTTDSLAATYAWELLDRPAGSTASLSSTATPSCNITPDRLGSYLVKLTINSTTEEYGLFSVRSLRSGLRLPAAGEGGVNAGGSLAGTRSWAADVNASLRHFDKYVNDNLVVAAINNTGGTLNAGLFVSLSRLQFTFATGVAGDGYHVLYSGTADEDLVPEMQASDATMLLSNFPNPADNVGYLLGLVGSPGGSVPNGSMGLVVLQGVVKTGIDTSTIWTGTLMLSSNSPGVLVPAATVSGSPIDLGLTDSPYVVAKTLSSDASGYMYIAGGENPPTAFSKHLSAPISTAGALKPGQLINSVIEFNQAAPIIITTPLSTSYDPSRLHGQTVTFWNNGSGNVTIDGGDANVQGGGTITTLAAGNVETYVQRVNPVTPAITYIKIS